MTTSTEIESMTDEQRNVAFVRELTALTRKYQIAVGSCGCCESIWLEKIDGTELDVEAGYAMNSENADGLRWAASPYYCDPAKIVR